MIDKKLDKISEDIADIKVILGKQQVSLDYHVYRTELAETNIELLRGQLAPIQTKMNKLEGALKFIGVLALFSTIGTFVLKLFGKI